MNAWAIRREPESVTGSGWGGETNAATPSESETYTVIDSMRAWPARRRRRSGQKASAETRSSSALPRKGELL